MSRDTKLLLAPEVFLGRLYAYVSEKELDRLQFAARQVRQTRACAPQIVVPADVDGHGCAKHLGISSIELGRFILAGDSDSSMPRLSANRRKREAIFADPYVTVRAPLPVANLESNDLYSGRLTCTAMVLNEEYSFGDVRYLISSKVGERMPARNADGNKPVVNPSLPNLRQISYDVGLSFVTHPDKKLFEPGTVLVRLDFPVNLALFMCVWWMRREVLEHILRSADSDSAALRREWQNVAAMPKAPKGVRTSVIEIVLTKQVYGWIGKASPLFHKTGGVEQIFLPNLARGAGPSRSDFARLLTTYTLPAT